MITKVYDNPTIYKIDVPLPNNPLKNLNSYVIQDGGESLIVDTGFNRPECKAALLEGLQELNVNWEKTNMFLTHLHSDHSGLAPAVMYGKPGKIFMSKKDYDYLGWILNGNRWDTFDIIYRKEGFTEEQVNWLKDENPARGFEPDYYFDAEIVEDGDRIQVGSYHFQCVYVPGHTPGQICLFLPEKKLMLSGDHILFDITPNITSWVAVEDSLGDYLDSLVKIRKYDMETVLPAHRKNEMDVYVRIDEIIHHHLIRLEETIDAVGEFPNAHATKIGSCLKWSMRGKTWDEFPLSQRWFAVGETMSHLDYLIKRGLVEKTEDEFYGYKLTNTAEACKEKLNQLWRAYKK
ncbi:MBL fold metallo-hydrolase [Anaerotignum sp.]|uniref:MBL fold metallo-hydrolase n=1 Tax=Anaerotignum sp. TaxID=2039241 RepID=UPI0028AA1832|nr:MBL fold metallo-hydrolase [Anaerotignum sp.]